MLKYKLVEQGMQVSLLDPIMFISSIHIDMWIFFWSDKYEGLIVVLNKFMRRVKKGHPPIIRIRIEMDDVEIERRYARL